VYELYGKKFAFIPFFHKSKFTRNSADDVELRNVSVTATSQVYRFFLFFILEGGGEK
jgi:hypothetical protein